LVICIGEQEVHWFDFRGGREIKPNRQGIYHSRVFPGLWIDRSALLQRNTRRLIEGVQQGIASPEHRAFVKKLETAKRKGRK
jgi:hypothetical protein